MKCMPLTVAVGTGALQTGVLQYSTAVSDGLEACS